jgi:hypothetical protein
MNGPEQIHICEFEASSGLLDPVEVLLVVKSQDQIQRRHRMLGQLQRGKIGRIQPRPIAEGLLVKCCMGRAVSRAPARGPLGQGSIFAYGNQWGQSN